MKISNTATAVRVTLSPTEISDLQFVIEAAERAGHYMPARVLNIMAALTRSADDVRMKQAMKRAEKDTPMRLLIRMRANGLTWCFMKSCRGRFPINTNSGATCGVSTLSNWTAARLALL